MQPWQFTANVKVNSENELPTLLWPETLRRTDSEIRVLRRASLTVIVLGAVPRLATALPQGRCLETSTTLGLSEPTGSSLLRKSYLSFRDS
jgi:hypothetical protein